MTWRDRWYTFKTSVLRNPIDYDEPWNFLTPLMFGVVCVLCAIPFLGFKSSLPFFALGTMVLMMASFVWKEFEDNIRRYLINPVKRFFNINVVSVKWWQYFLMYGAVLILNGLWYQTLGLNLDVLGGNSPWFLLGPSMTTLYAYLGLFAFDHYRDKITLWFKVKYFRHVKRTFSDIDYVTSPSDEDTESYLDRLGVYDRMPVSCCEARKKARQMVNARGSERERLMQEMLEDMERIRRRNTHWDVDDDHH